MHVAGHVTGALRHAFHENRWLILACGANVLAARLLAAAYGLEYENNTALFLLKLLGVMLPLYLFVMSVVLLVSIARQRPAGRPIPLYLAELRRHLSDAPRLASGAVALGAFSFFFDAFSYIKSIIPAVNPFGWDTTFAALDRSLHGGMDPYHWTMQLMGNPLATTALNGAYHFWLLLLYFVVMAGCFTGTNPGARRTFLLSFTLVWGLGGNLLAIVFSSAGPCYYAALGLGDRYEPLMQTLRQFHGTSPVWALHVQDLLWTGYQSGEGLRGISAFPSMHVASTTLMTLYAFTWRRWAGGLMVGFLGLILVGSVHLGWHYAVDGYASIALTAAVWFAVRRMIEGRASGPEADPQPARM
ncbi:phosphatase PAP2 family protein [Cereibacter azotoformans]|uniref:PAP2 superfamily protein n=1 Tax=Cereibacter azotoformans TaxID=43057 RepID=A0A2T5KF68_9RHOB|nr:phosphatase PAP2 family protein [Cereibacter azotoformans]AXQ92677.1 inositol phosphorylceramide synthase [Cereibacter sphaeroides]MBO4169737.1 inositol phosphorylceramide synthase [Cereibacter azotoformans]PTR21002.1 PAP2 superfamily protein [Cereibacter azotoformans]UIJ30957.1 phosphatase PAP2 family protein [Cereibacter azotoformans]